MYKNRLADGSCNICGRKVARLRSGLSPKVSQRALAERMQLEGVDLDKNAIQRIECGKRFVTDIELRAPCRGSRHTQPARRGWHETNVEIKNEESPVHLYHGSSCHTVSHDIYLLSDDKGVPDGIPELQSDECQEYQVGGSGKFQ